MLGHQAVEQRLVGILQPAQQHIALEIGLERMQGFHAAADLHLERADMRRQEAVQPEGVALVVGERRALVEQRIGQQVGAGEIDLDRVVVSHRRPSPDASGHRLTHTRERRSEEQTFFGQLRAARQRQDNAPARS